MTKKLSDLETKGDSVSLGLLGDTPFNILSVEESNYEDQSTHEVSEGVKITTKETLEKDSVTYNKFHTTRRAVVSKLKSPAVAEAIANGDLGPVRCVSTTFENGKTGFILEDV